MSRQCETAQQTCVSKDREGNEEMTPMKRIETWMGYQ